MKVESIQHLKQLSTEGTHEFYIQLNYGLRSSKYIAYDSFHEVFDITNEIDDTQEILSEGDLFTESNIGEAIQKGAFYSYD